ncbi:MAG: hypothetical protein [Bacteriophage sp.]|nr:MAG: hypothetical protein [Bacteriophage sp.]
MLFFYSALVIGVATLIQKAFNDPDRHERMNKPPLAEGQAS